MTLPESTPVPQWILDKEAADERALETIDDRQLELFPANWSPFGANGRLRPTLMTTEGWTPLGALTED